MKIKAFGKLVTREQAEQIIINDFICDITYAQNTETLEELLFHGWKALDEWDDKELEEYIEELCVENQPNPDKYE